METDIQADVQSISTLQTKLSAKLVPFDYESKTWGAHEVRVSPSYLGALRLRYCLNELANVRGKVLEVGCGGGGMIRGISNYRSDLELHACDFSENAIRAARMSTPVDRVHYGIADGYLLPYGSETFDAYVMFDVLEHVEEPSQILDEIFRVLKPGGLFSIFVPCEGERHTLHGLLGMLGWRAKEYYGGHIQQFTAVRLRELLDRAGFPISSLRWSCHLINQFADVSYFTALSIAGRNSSVSVEGYLSGNGASPLGRILSISKNSIAAASFFESRFLGRVPGSGAHLAGYKHASPSERHPVSNGTSSHNHG